jgi:hypothetical protein
MDRGDIIKILNKHTDVISPDKIGVIADEIMGSYSSEYGTDNFIILDDNYHPMTCDKWTNHCEVKRGCGEGILTYSGDRYVCPCGYYEQLISGKDKVIHINPKTNKPI